MKVHIDYKGLEVSAHIHKIATPTDRGPKYEYEIWDCYISAPGSSIDLFDDLTDRTIEAIYDRLIEESNA